MASLKQQTLNWNYLKITNEHKIFILNFHSNFTWNLEWTFHFSLEAPHPFPSAFFIYFFNSSLFIQKFVLHPLDTLNIWMPRKYYIFNDDFAREKSFLSHNVAFEYHGKDHSVMNIFLRGNYMLHMNVGIVCSELLSYWKLGKTCL